MSRDTLFCFALQPVHTPVPGSEHALQTSLPHRGHVLPAGLPQTLHIPTIVMADQ